MPIVEYVVAQLHLEVGLGEECGEMIVLVLGPAFERVVVALVAVEARAEEEVGGVFHGLRRRAEDLVVGGGGVFLVGTLGGEDVADEVVVGDVVFHLLADPVAEQLRAFLADSRPVREKRDAVIEKLLALELDKEIIVVDDDGRARLARVQQRRAAAW